jgi:plastocyanin
MKLLSCLLIAALASLAQDEPEPAKPTTLGTVSGRVVFEGKLPEVKPIAIKDSQIRPECCGDPDKVDRTNRSLLIDAKTRGIRNAVVTLTVPTIDMAVPEEPIVIDQKGCRFEPHIAVVPVGATIQWKNSDPGSHNIHTYARKNSPSNRTIASNADHNTRFKRAEVVKVTCDLHPWMAAQIFVTDATHYALTDANGSFSLEGVPPGSYTVNVWHETLGRKRLKVLVGADGKSKPVDVKLAAKSKKKRRGK